MSTLKPPTRKTPLAPVRTRTWQEVLHLAKFPERAYVLDFETFFDTDFSLTKMSTIEHITDDRFEVLGLSVVDSIGEESFFIQGPKVRDWLDALLYMHNGDLDRCTIIAHNARYDMSILKWRYGISPKYIVDTLGLAQHWNARQKNGLEFIAKREGLPPKGDTMRFKEWTTRIRYKKRGGRGKQRLMPVQLPLITEDMWGELADYANHDGFLEWEIAKKYLPRLSRPEVELNALNHTLHLYTEPTLHVDYKEADILVQEMGREIDRVVHITGHTREQISGKHSFQSIMHESLDKAKDASRYMKTEKTPPGKPQRHKLAIAKDDPERELLEKHYDQTVRELMAAKEAISSWPSHIKRVKNIVAQCIAAGGVLPVPLGYCAAHTGRWGGSEKINLQNLGSRGHELVNRIRTLLIAPPGYELTIADEASVESRVLAWVAGEQWKLDAYEAGEEMYCRFAESVLGRAPGSLRKPYPEKDWERLGCIPAVEKRMKWSRNTIGKTGDLACGFGGGEAAIERFAPELPYDMRMNIRDTYRKQHPKVVKFWHELERKFIYVARFGKPCSMAHGLRLYQTPDANVIITLPSGRELKYIKVQVKGEQRTSRAGNEYTNYQASVYNEQERKWEYTWGGTITENIVQAIARDLLWEAIIQVEATGYRVVHHVHDELIVLVKKGQGGAVLELALKAIRKRPTWAPDCPLDGEGLVTQRYGGH